MPRRNYRRTVPQRSKIIDTRTERALMTIVKMARRVDNVTAPAVKVTR